MPPPHHPHPPLPPIPPNFTAQKTHILASLSSSLPPSSSSSSSSSSTTIKSDNSPKGHPDTPLLPLLSRINALEGVVSTSSCSGRVSVFLEGRGKEGGDGKGGEGGGGGKGRVPVLVPVGGKGRGGRWLFVWHEGEVDGEGVGERWERVRDALGVEVVGGGDEGADGNGDIKDIGMGVQMERLRLVRLQFEPMILHIMAASLAHASPILAAAINAGFRESGVQSLKNLEDPLHSFPMVAVRTAGLAFQSVIGYVLDVDDNGDGAEEEEKEEKDEEEKDDEEKGGGERIRSLVTPAHLRLLLGIANGRFHANKLRMQRFEDELFKKDQKKQQEETEWEDSTVRQARKREEGLRKREEMRNASQVQRRENEDGNGEDGDEDGQEEMANILP